MTSQNRSSHLIIRLSHGDNEVHEITKQNGLLWIDGEQVDINSVGLFLEDDEEKDEYNRYIDQGYSAQAASLMAALFFFSFEGSIDGDGVLMELMNAIALHVYLEDYALANEYVVNEEQNLLTISGTNLQMSLPTTGSEFSSNNIVAQFTKLHQNLIHHPL